MPLFCEKCGHQNIDMGDVLYKEQKYEEALKCFDKALSIDPENDEIKRKQEETRAKEKVIR